MVQFFEVTCDGCHTWGMANYRYKCLRCEDYDLCAKCYERGPAAVGHDEEHPFQCLMSRGARELHFAGEPIPDLCADSFTCPVCGGLGHSAEELVAHVQLRHSQFRAFVICPLCVAVPLAHPVRITNLVTHLSTMHRPNEDFGFSGLQSSAARRNMPSPELPHVRFVMPQSILSGSSSLAVGDDLSDSDVVDV